jgi:D-alanine-D-alanine ligase
MSNRLKIALLYGGKNGEHEVSLASAASVLKHLSPEQYDVTPISIDKQGHVYLQSVDELRQFETVLPVQIASSRLLPSLIVDTTFCIPVDVVFPVMHGVSYEDGCLQGLLKLANVAYVGCDVLSSAVGMDKDLTRRIACDEQIQSTQYLVINKNHSDNDWESMIERAIEQFGFPMFIKPCSSGSSVGIHKAKNRQEIFTALQDALRYDEEALIEACVYGREIEVAVLEDLKGRCIKSSVPGEICVNHPDGFYSYNAKYINSGSSEYLIPAPLSQEWTDKICDAAVKIFQRLKCKGLARVDFFFDEKNQCLYFNEINTMPGFTSISLYPSMWAKSGINFPDLLASLIETAILQQEVRKNLVTDFKV